MDISFQPWLGILIYLALAQEMYFWWLRQPPVQVESYIPPPPYAPRGSQESSQTDYAMKCVAQMGFLSLPEHELITNAKTIVQHNIRRQITSGTITFQTTEYDESIRAKLAEIYKTNCEVRT